MPDRISAEYVLSRLRSEEPSEQRLQWILTLRRGAIDRALEWLTEERLYRQARQDSLYGRGRHRQTDPPEGSVVEPFAELPLPDLLARQEELYHQRATDHQIARTAPVALDRLRRQRGARPAQTIKDETYSEQPFLGEARDRQRSRPITKFDALLVNEGWYLRGKAGVHEALRSAAERLRALVDLPFRAPVDRAEIAQAAIDAKNVLHEVYVWDPLVEIVGSPDGRKATLAMGRAAAYEETEQALDDFLEALPTRRNDELVEPLARVEFLFRSAVGAAEVALEQAQEAMQAASAVTATRTGYLELSRVQEVIRALQDGWETVLCEAIPELPRLLDQIVGSMPPPDPEDPEVGPPVRLTAGLRTFLDGLPPDLYDTWHTVVDATITALEFERAKLAQEIDIPMPPPDGMEPPTDGRGPERNGPEPDDGGKGGPGGGVPRPGPLPRNGPGGGGAPIQRGVASVPSRPTAVGRATVPDPSENTPGPPPDRQGAQQRARLAMATRRRMALGAGRIRRSITSAGRKPQLQLPPPPQARAAIRASSAGATPNTGARVLRRGIDAHSSDAANGRPARRGRSQRAIVNSSRPGGRTNHRQVKPLRSRAITKAASSPVPQLSATAVRRHDAGSTINGQLHDLFDTPARQRPLTPNAVSAAVAERRSRPAAVTTQATGTSTGDRSSRLEAGGRRVETASRPAAGRPAAAPTRGSIGRAGPSGVAALGG